MDGGSTNSDLQQYLPKKSETICRRPGVVLAAIGRLKNEEIEISI